MLLSDFIREGISSLRMLYPENEARNIVLILCGSIIGTKSYTHIVEPRTEVPEAAMGRLRDALARLSGGEPLQYVTGKAEFNGRSFNVSPAVLIPRPETELLCREAVAHAIRLIRMRFPFGKNAEPVRVLDLCTGSGCIAWTLALSAPGCIVTGVDISEEALRMAAGQDFTPELKTGSARRPVFVKADILNDSPELGKFDIVLSNPPYIMESEKKDMRVNVLDHEPGIALFVPDDDPLVFYRAVACWSRRCLLPGGMGMAEINERLGRETSELFREAGFSDVSVVKDLNDRNRFVIYRLAS